MSQNDDDRTVFLFLDLSEFDASCSQLFEHVYSIHILLGLIYDSMKLRDNMT